jgi:hypothetical protein
MFLELIYIVYLFYSQYNTISLIRCISQEGDSFTCEPSHTSYRCTAKRIKFMSTAVFASKFSRDRRRDIRRAAARKGLVIQRMKPGKPVDNWGVAPDHVHSPGPNAANYEQFPAHAGAHLVFNIFWKIQHFCVHQIFMRDPMPQIDLGAIVHLIRAILRKFKDCVEIAFEKVGLAAKN